ncbi:hypothetical protein ILUMI_05181 [Ignelater luminosus]|uniref:Mos1 transposase HTH domain-containing protein n=1 Tax=Ignelater luminosus TaxID=2038154 RepID=A0A8K0GIW5_IGNLU|nr:hypothetical protein ILUMI_05181 [Ignelater luminosus]
MPPPIENPTDCEVRSVIHFLSAKGVKAIEIHRNICEVYGQNIMSDGMVLKWVRAFKDGRKNVHDKERNVILQWATTKIQKRLRKLWEELFSEKDAGESESEFENVYLSDRYQPTDSESSDSSDEEACNKTISFYESKNDADNTRIDNGGIYWGPVDESSLKLFDFTKNNTGIKLKFYEEYTNKDPYNFFLIFVTDGIIQYMVGLTNLFAEQIAKVVQKPKGHVKAWIPTNRD